jgi:ABC-type bacteriocin/lantibiotic exporter with double-glycine peptidase domain
LYKAAQIALAATTLTGCTYLGSARGFDPGEFKNDPRWVAVDGVPLILQRDEKDCGAAAAAMVLAHWNRPSPLEEVLAIRPPAEGRGMTAGDLRACFEAKGLKAFTGKGTLDLLLKQIRKGRPAIVGLVKPNVTGIVTHFEVIVAWHPVDNRVVALDPARGWRQNDLDGFFAEWEPAGRLLLVVTEPQ